VLTLLETKKRLAALASLRYTCAVLGLKIEETILTDSFFLGNHTRIDSQLKKIF
jgi:hypothetical protein